MRVCSYRSSCLYLPVVLVDCQVEGHPLRSHHICQGEYVVLNDIDFDGAERKIFRDCVDAIQGKGKSETLKKVGDSTVYGTDESEEDKEKWRGKCLEEAVMRPVPCLLFTPMGKLVSHHSVLFCLLVHHINLLILPSLSLLEYTVFKGISRRRGGGEKKHIKPQEEKDRHKEKRKQMRVTVQAKLVVGY